MPSVTRTKPGPARNQNEARGESAGRLDRRAKLFIAGGVIGAIFFAIGATLLMWGLESSSQSELDPDAGTPVILPDHPRHLADFSLRDQLGRTVTAHDLQGKIVLVNFVLTSCSVTCPYVNAQMEKIQQATAGNSNVRLLSLTLIPDDDTVDVLARYATSFGADPGRWSFLTGDTAAIRQLVGTSFLAKDTTGAFSYMPGNFANTQRIVLVDQAGRIVCYFDGLNQNAGDQALARIKQLEAGD
jgi:cytochrome oxidase Cu insertion factor (SCO1/SenC/PrrC family)